MEVCAGFELIAMENATALGDGLLEICEGLEVAVSYVGIWETGAIRRRAGMTSR